MDREHIQAVVEVVPEALLFHQPEEVAVRSGDDAHVHLDGFRAADPLEFLLLQHPEELRLQLQWVSPTSSRKRVPPSATWNRPIL